LRRVTSERRALSMALELTLSGKIYKRHFAEAIDSDRGLIALQHSARQLKGEWVLLWDRAKLHRSNKVKAYLAHNSPANRRTKIFSIHMAAFAANLRINSHTTAQCQAWS
jgi:hypothetical protein